MRYFVTADRPGRTLAARTLSLRERFLSLQLTGTVAQIRGTKSFERLQLQTTTKFSIGSIAVPVRLSIPPNTFRTIKFPIKHLRLKFNASTAVYRHAVVRGYQPRKWVNSLKYILSVVQKLFLILQHIPRSTGNTKMELKAQEAQLHMSRPRAPP